MARMTFKEWAKSQNVGNYHAKAAWEACAVEYEHELSTLRETGPCGKHPRAFRSRDLHFSGSQPFGADKCVPDEHWHEFCTLCAEQSAREAALLEKIMREVTVYVMLGSDGRYISYEEIGRFMPPDGRSALDDLLREARWKEIEQCAIEAGERSPDGVSSHSMLGDMWDRRIAELRAALEPNKPKEGV